MKNAMNVAKNYTHDSSETDQINFIEMDIIQHIDRGLTSVMS